MAEVNTTQHTSAPAAAPSSTNSFIKRELNGASFLSLEHTGHMLLVVIVPLLVAAALTTALSSWLGWGDPITGFLAYGTNAMDASMLSMWFFAALVVLLPLLVVLDRRTRAEWAKRPGYANRLAYKLPLYGAIGLLAALQISTVIGLLATLITVLASLGLPNQEYTPTLFNNIPQLASLVFVGFALWYAVKLAKGHDAGKAFGLVMTVVGGVIAIILLVTAVTNMYKQETPTDLPGETMPFNEQNYDDLYKDLQQLENYQDIYR